MHSILVCLPLSSSWALVWARIEERAVQQEHTFLLLQNQFTQLQLEMQAWTSPEPSRRQSPQRLPTIRVNLPRKIIDQRLSVIPNGRCQFAIFVDRRGILNLCPKNLVKLTQMCYAPWNVTGAEMPSRQQKWEKKRGNQWPGAQCTSGLWKHSNLDPPAVCTP